MILNEATNIYLGQTSVSAVFLGSTQIWPHDYTKDYLTIEAKGTGNITIAMTDKTANTSYARTIYYSTDATNWISIQINNTDSLVFPVIDGSKLYLKGNNTEYQIQTLGYNHLNISADVAHIVYGNIMSMFYGDNFANQTVLPEASGGSTRHLWGFFRNNTYLTDASNLMLPATHPLELSYSVMFDGCSSLTGAPALPATNLNMSFECYSGMFKDCTSLTTAPDLPATTLAAQCYQSMFAGCTSLNYIKMMATDISLYHCLYRWTSSDGTTIDLPANGVFVMNSSATYDPVNDAGIPSGWTIQSI